MTYLFLAICSSSLVALILKSSENANYNRHAVTSVNYVAAFCISIILSYRETPAVGNISTSALAFMDEFSAVVLLNSAVFSSSASLIWAVLVGVLGGIIYCSGFLYIQKSIRENGVGMTGAVAKLGIFVPMVLSLILWKEIPSSIQVVGIILCVLSIITLSFPMGDIGGFKTFNATLFSLFLICGCGEFAGKFFEKYAMVEYKAVFLFTVFFVAFWISLAFTIKGIKQGAVVKLRDVAMGIFVGIPNLFTPYFLISSFKHYPATVVFPVFCSASIVLINVGGYFVFRERLTRGELSSLAMIVVAVVLMNVG